MTAKATKVEVGQTNTSEMFEKSGDHLASMDSTQLDSAKETQKIELLAETGDQARDAAKADTSSNIDNVNDATKADVKNQDAVDQQAEKAQEAKDQEEEQKEQKEAQTEEQEEVVSSATSST